MIAQCLHDCRERPPHFASASLKSVGADSFDHLVGASEERGGDGPWHLTSRRVCAILSSHMENRSGSMGWFRQKVPSLSRLALFALAVQIVLSFGHAHLGVVALASAAGVNAPAVESNSAAAPGPALPIDRDRNSPAHDFCALCASISLLHSLVLPVPAALAALAEFDCIQFRYASATAVLAHPRSPSQARAPPFA